MRNKILLIIPDILKPKPKSKKRKETHGTRNSRLQDLVHSSDLRLHLGQHPTGSSANVGAIMIRNRVFGVYCTRIIIRNSKDRKDDSGPYYYGVEGLGV